MFEKPTSDSSIPLVRGVERLLVPVLAPAGEPIEFLYKGRHFHVHTILSRWRESGGWWNRIDDGNNRLNEKNHFDDGARAIWQVEAAPEGTLTTFEIELDEITERWQIRPTSRPL